MSKVQVNNVIRDATPEEENQIQVDKETFIEEDRIRQEKITAKANLKASAKAKLVAGEALTEEEADTIVL
tara:strand:- start:1231 stop:1440 length:210 start_codon:yes stop_codon:yes gene_type:complete